MVGVSADHILKIKDCKNIDKYLDLARELKNLWNMKVMVILIEFDALVTVSKRVGVKVKIRGRVETIQT